MSLQYQPHKYNTIPYNYQEITIYHLPHHNLFKMNLKVIYLFGELIENVNLPDASNQQNEHFLENQSQYKLQCYFTVITSKNAKKTPKKTSRNILLLEGHP